MTGPPVTAEGYKDAGKTQQTPAAAPGSRQDFDGGAAPGVPYPQRPVPVRGRRMEVVTREYPVFFGNREGGFFVSQEKPADGILLQYLFAV